MATEMRALQVTGAHLGDIDGDETVVEVVDVFAESHVYIRRL